MVLTLATLIPLGMSQSATYHVPVDFETIQAAIDSATHGDEIVVATGTYRENIHFRGKNIVVRSNNPKNTTIVANTIIFANRLKPVVTFEGTENTKASLSGFTITNGYNLSGGGAAGVLANNAKARISHNVIRNNRGGGINRCDGTITFNLIKDNIGAGSGISYSDSLCIGNIIVRNLGGIV
ncbi:MAG: hypothetical protein KC944_25415, partial [Candidatus Omnitrophica bacterium]|nr:hypothetical protein [Candidatus Omnitrophota bacterium]